MISTFVHFFVNYLTAPNALSDSNLPDIDPLSD